MIFDRTPDLPRALEQTGLHLRQLLAMAGEGVCAASYSDQVFGASLGRLDMAAVINYVEQENVFRVPDKGPNPAHLRTFAGWENGSEKVFEIHALWAGSVERPELIGRFIGSTVLGYGPHWSALQTAIAFAPDRMSMVGCAVTFGEMGLGEDRFVGACGFAFGACELAQVRAGQEPTGINRSRPLRTLLRSSTALLGALARRRDLVIDSLD